MPFTYRIDRWRRRVVSRFWGVTGDAELLEYYERLRHDPAFDPSYTELGDLRGVERLQTAAVTVELVARLRIFAPGARRAVVARSELAFHVARHFAAHAAQQRQEFAAFHDEAEATAWLDDADGARARRPGAAPRAPIGRRLLRLPTPVTEPPVAAVSGVGTARSEAATGDLLTAARLTPPLSS